MQINIKTSEANREVVTTLTQKLGLGAENIIARVALSYSISRNRKLDLKDIADSKGKEYKEDILFGRYKPLYISLVAQHYGLYKTDNSIPKFIKMHVDDGLVMIEKFISNNPRHSGFDFLIDNIERGIEAIENSNTTFSYVENKNAFVNEKRPFDGPIKIRVGKDIQSGEEIFLRFNSTDYNNNHVAIAGNSGTGKTHFALNFLEQVVEKSKGAINYVFLDFKGLKRDDVKLMQPFFKKTHTTFIDAPQKPFPVNPLSFIDLINEKNRILGINKFVDIISHYSNIGKNQEQVLKDATKEVFDGKKAGEYPSFKEIYDAVLNITGTKVSMLHKILQDLSEMELFESAVHRDKNFIEGNYYFSLSGELSDNVRFTSVFLIINYIYNTFMNMENAPVEGEVKSMRYVFVIDEAHVIFKEKKSQEMLEKMLREIRSKGVSVMLLSQGIEEFIQPSFDFSSMCEMGLLFDIKNKNTKMITRFLGLPDAEATKVARSMERIKKYQAISNLKEYKRGELLQM